MNEKPPLRIAMVTSALSRRGAGVSAVVEALSRAVGESGADVRVFGPTDEDWVRHDRSIWIGSEALALDQVGPRSIGYMPRLTLELALWEPSIVHLHGLWMAASRSVLHWHNKTGKPYIISPHGMLSAEALSYSKIKKRAVLAAYQRVCFEQASAIHVTSKQEEMEVGEFGINKPCLVVANGVSMPSPVDQKPNNATREILYFGRLHYKKGIDILLQAWAQIHKLRPDWGLRIVGPDEKQFRSKLESLAEDLGLPRVTFQGPIFGEAKYDLMRRADMVVLPTRSENFGLVVAESLSVGTPVICTKAAPWEQLVEKQCGWWVAPTPEAIASAIETAIGAGHEKRIEMGRNGRSWVKQAFAWAAIGDRMLACYEALAARPSDAQLG